MELNSFLVCRLLNLVIFGAGGETSTWWVRGFFLRITFMFIQPYFVVFIFETDVKDIITFSIQDVNDKMQSNNNYFQACNGVPCNLYRVTVYKHPYMGEIP